jgi:hypothetical protein
MVRHTESSNTFSGNKNLNRWIDAAAMFGGGSSGEIATEGLGNFI